jgi:flagellar protein FliS
MTWKTAYLETRVLSADPVELVNIMYEYAIMRVQEARDSLAQGDIAARAKAISKSIAILGELDTSLDHERGGEIAANLARLYQYMRVRLTAANLQQADEPLAEVEGLLKTLGEAWQAIGQEEPAPEMAKTPAAEGAFFAMEAMPAYCEHAWSA